MARSLQQVYNSEQQLILAHVPANRLVLAQFVGVRAGMSSVVPSPSGVLVDEFNLPGDYGRAKGGDLLHVLAEDADYTNYFQKSKQQVEAKSTAKAKAKPKAAAKPNTVKVER